MKKFALKLIILCAAFTVGIETYRFFIPKVSLFEISENISYYNEKTVEIETFIILRKENSFKYFLSDFDKKISSVMSVYIEDETKKPQFLQVNLLNQNPQRVKVLIKGKVLDECNINGRP